VRNPSLGEQRLSASVEVDRQEIAVANEGKSAKR
jgi:hypothetical protein